jgi:hypothetical protein
MYVATRRGHGERRLGYKYNFCLFLNTKVCVVWWLAPSARSALFLRALNVGRVKPW